MLSTTANELVHSVDDVTTALSPAAAAASLFRYDAACRAVAEARRVDEVLEITAHAEAMRAYARQAKNRQFELDAAEIRIRAERRLGELMAAQKAAVGVAKGNQHSARGGKNPEQPATLAEAGIDKNLAKRARTLAAVPGEKFEKLLSEKRQREDWRTVLHPLGDAAEAGGITRERVESAAIRFAEQLATQNEALALQIETLVRRVAAALDEAKMWKERALAAGWTEEHADA